MVTPRTDGAADVRVNSALTGRESAELDVWLAARYGEVTGVEIDQCFVTLHGKHPYLKAPATATATRQPGQLVDALNDAFHRLHTEGGGS
ncbi:MAG: hypothetical protein QOC57_2082 [Ilumatobacteraceae bacterium]|jgi:hypothetical protein